MSASGPRSTRNTDAVNLKNSKGGGGVGMGVGVGWGGDHPRTWVEMGRSSGLNESVCPARIHVET